MIAILLMLGSFFGFIVAYQTYGRFLARKVFQLDPRAIAPSRALEDGVDYVPSRKSVIFGHHFASIAGTGPIVGPAIGVIWGWLPALLWVLLGSIFIGAVHDFGALIVSMRNEGKSISEIAARYLNGRVRFIFFLIVFLALLIVIAIFGMVIAVVFKFFPSSVIPVWTQIPIAMLLGVAIYKKNARVLPTTVLAVIAMYLFIVLGAVVDTRWPGCTLIPDFSFMPATGSWTIILLIYAFFASILPVTILLQPRDYINAWQLFGMMGVLVLGALASGFTGQLELVAPAINTADTGAPPIWPFMFVTIACGAVSGFHALVASGTSPKQVADEPDSLFVGYGSMLTEGALAVLVLVCVAAGIGMDYRTADGQALSGLAAWSHHYHSWSGAEGMAANLKAVVNGAANMMQTLFIPLAVGQVIMGVFIASFAGTTLDTAVRLQRYIVSELAADTKIPGLQNKWTATFFAVATAAGLAFATGADGKGAMTLWPLFGAINQLLAVLALLVVTFYLRRRGGWHFLLTLLPCLFMAVITLWALALKLVEYYRTGAWLLVAVAGVIGLLALWVLAEAVLIVRHRSGAPRTIIPQP